MFYYKGHSMLTALSPAQGIQAKRAGQEDIIGARWSDPPATA